MTKKHAIISRPEKILQWMVSVDPVGKVPIPCPAMFFHLFSVRFENFLNQSPLL